jgi:hypothetical protein
VSHIILFNNSTLVAFVFLSHPLFQMLQTLLLALVFVLAALLAPPRWQKSFDRTESFLSHFAARRTPVLLILFFSVVAFRLALLPLLHVPVPGIHDEFSYLLLGDTLAHGRLANPTPPMWPSFDTFHVNFVPTYSSMYPPAQGFVLAIGQLLGHPWIGVLLSAAAMCAAITWMLQAWMPARWAFLGGALVALKFGVASYWINSYWGGAAAAIGGALVLGAVPRLSRRPTIKLGLAMGVGIAILANSRPFEGLVFCIPVALWFLWWLAGKPTTPSAQPARRAKFLASLFLVLLGTAAFMGYYNWRLTGNALLMPHVLRFRNYHSSALFLWQYPPRPALHYNNAQFEEFYNGWERENYHHTWGDAWRVTKEKFKRDGHAFLWWGVLLVLPGIPFAFRDRKMRLIVVVAVLGAIAIFSLIWSFAHYAAPFTCVIVALLVQSMRHLRTIRLRRWPLGQWLVRASVFLLILETAGYLIHHQCDPLSWTCQGDPSRAAIQNQLAHTPGKHLILVRYDPENHNVHDDWVFNGAEIDNAKVLWARELDAPQNGRLLAYFKDRRVWLVEPDTDNTELVPYSPPTK